MGLSGRQVRIDVALVPSVAEVVPGRVLIVVDQIRASTTITTALDLGCAELLLAGDVATARRLHLGTDRLLAGEQQARKPADFDHDNSPSELARVGVDGRDLILCTTNGTAVVSRLRAADHLLIGCVRNARAVAAAALAIGSEADGGAGRGADIQVVCAGQDGGFVIDDAVAAGVIASRIAELARTAGDDVVLSDAAQAAMRLRESYPSLLAAMTDSDGGVTLVDIGQPDDIAFCADEDASETVPTLVPDEDLRIVAMPVAARRPQLAGAAREG